MYFKLDSNPQFLAGAASFTYYHNSFSPLVVCLVSLFACLFGFIYGGGR